MDSQQTLVTQQFGKVAAAYATSATHTDKDALARVIELAQPVSTDVMADIATGAGNVALAFAPLVSRVVAVDITQSMLDETSRRAVESGYLNLNVLLAPAEQLPFAESSLDLVTVRTAPHHYSDIQAAINEMFRVLKPGGRAVIVDTSSPEDDQSDIELNEIETLRDPSHVRNYRPSEWQKMLEFAGFTIKSLEVGKHALGKKMSFQAWTKRMLVTSETELILQSKINDTCPLLKAELELEPDGNDFWFTLPEVTILVEKLL
jgi:ubiquinone/menaquinone biosynthesis C-methylase UbiE